MNGCVVEKEQERLRCGGGGGKGCCRGCGVDGAAQVMGARMREEVWGSVWGGVGSSSRGEAILEQ